MTPTGFRFRTGPHTELDVSGVAAARDDLVGIADRATDMRPAMRVVKHLLVEGNEKVFTSKGSAIGVPWPDLKPGTLARKARTGIPSLSSLMVESGDLEVAATGGKGSRSRATRSSASAGVSPFYAVFHLGARDGELPPRPPVGIPADTEFESLTIMERFLIRGKL